MSENESAKKLSELAGVSKRTAQRWLNGADVPLSVIRLLEQKYTGGIPQEGEWKGFILNRYGELVSPEGYIVTPSKIKSMWISEWAAESRNAQIRRLEREIKELKQIGSEETKNTLVDLASKMLELAGNTQLKKVV